MRYLVKLLFFCGLLIISSVAEKRTLDEIEISISCGLDIRVLSCKREEGRNDFSCSFETSSTSKRFVGRLEEGDVLSLEREWTECAKMPEMTRELDHSQYSLCISLTGQKGPFSRGRSFFPVTDSAFQSCLKHTLSLLPQLETELKMSSEKRTTIQRIPLERLCSVDLTFFKGSEPEFIIIRLEKDPKSDFICSRTYDLTEWTHLGSLTQTQTEEMVETWEKFLVQMNAGGKDGDIEGVSLVESFDGASYARRFSVDWRPDSVNLPNPILKLNTLVPGLRALIYGPGRATEPNSNH